MFVGKDGMYPSEALFRRSTLGRVPGLLVNIRLGWEGLQGTNTLAYYEHS
jgi:hypothetical protein